VGIPVTVIKVPEIDEAGAKAMRISVGISRATEIAFQCLREKRISGPGS
jgi:ribosomal protein L3